MLVAFPSHWRGEKMFITELKTHRTSQWVSGDRRFTPKEKELLTKQARAIIGEHAPLPTPPRIDPERWDRNSAYFEGVAGWRPAIVAGALSVGIVRRTIGGSPVTMTADPEHPATAGPPGRPAAVARQLPIDCTSARRILIERIRP